MLKPWDFELQNPARGNFENTFELSNVLTRKAF